MSTPPTEQTVEGGSHCGAVRFRIEVNVYCLEGIDPRTFASPFLTGRSGKATSTSCSIGSH